MSYAGVQMFMEKLKQLINCNNHPSINKRTIRRKRPEFQLLFNDLDSMIQSLFIGEYQELHELEKVNDMKERFVHAAEEAEYIVDLFISGVHIRKKDDHATRSFMYVVDVVLSYVNINNNGRFPTSRDFNRSLNKVRRSFKSVKEEFMSMRIDNTKMESSRRTIERKHNQPVVAGGSKKLLDEIVVGFDADVEVIRDKLVEDRRKLDIVSIVGMGGIGKTTLATKVFNDGYVKHHFHARVWITVSQTYDKRDVLIQILESISCQLDLEVASDSRLREMVHKKLMGKRYLIVIDDIWHIETWDNLQVLFRDDNNGSRVLLTSRLNEVAKHANSNGLIHHLGCLNKDRSWELLCKKVFNGDEFPEWSMKPGMQIVENCQGLPLALVVIAGVLAKEAWSETLWLEVANKIGSYIAGDENGSVMESLGLSYNHLPLHLRECFLYLGGFPEDYKFHVRWLIWLWVAEGLIKKVGDRSLEDIADGYLMDLIDRNLVMVAERRTSNGGVKYCKLHDLVGEICVRKAKEERFILQNVRLISSSQFTYASVAPYKRVRMFINKDTYDPDFAHSSTQNLRSIMCFGNFRSLSDDNSKYLRSVMLITVLDIQQCGLNDFPKSIGLLIHLRYLAVKIASYGFPASICNLWNLQTLIYNTENPSSIVLPNNISDLVNLRHFRSSKGTFVLLSIEKPMNLQTISNVWFKNRAYNIQTCFPCIKELSCKTYLDEGYDFKCLGNLTHLEKLKLTDSSRTLRSIGQDSPRREQRNHIAFPTTLKALTLANCKLQWSDMSIIQSLPNLQILKLHYKAFEGICWNTNEHEFRQLKFLRLEWLNINHWEVYGTSFPCLRRLEVSYCWSLEEIPYEIGNIPTLELIKIKKCRQSVDESVRRIQDEQQDFGNYDLKIDLLEHA